MVKPMSKGELAPPDADNGTDTFSHPAIPEAASLRRQAAQAGRGLRLRVDLVDIRNTSVRPVQIWLEGDMLQIAAPGLMRQVALPQIDWHHSLGRQFRQTARLPDGSALCAIQPEEWDVWCAHALRPAAVHETWQRADWWWLIGAVAL